MSLIRPFAGLRPAAGRAGEVLAPPYDVLSSEEARERAADRPWSFLHVSKPEIDLPPETDVFSEEVYAKAVSNLKRMIRTGVLVRDAQPCYYIYRLVHGDHGQVGLVAAASVAAYNAERIKRHEFTRPDKEDDRVCHIEAVNAQTGPVLLAYPSAPAADALIARASAGEPDADAVADTGVRHTLWVVRDAALIDAITRAFEAIPSLYIADGHHRSAAASRVAALRRDVDPDAAELNSDYFLTVIFPHHALRILDYNRLVTDLNGLDAAGFIERVKDRFEVHSSGERVKPAGRGQFGLYVAGQWYRLAIRPEYVPAQDPVARLDVSLLANHLLWHVLGIGDLRRDPRVDFVGGIRGLGELERRVDSGEMAAAFALYPTSMEDLMAVSDAGQVMPPKSTWFEPKLADGLVSHVLD